MSREVMKLALEALAVKFSEGWHEGIKIDASDIMLLNDAAQALAEQPAQQELNESDDLTIAYMAGVHRGKELAKQPSTEDSSAVEQPAQQNSVAWAHKHINATLAAFGPDEAISMTQDTWAKLREAMSVLIEQPAQHRAWFTVGELNAWADKKLKENPQWAEQPSQQEPVKSGEGASATVTITLPAQQEPVPCCGKYKTCTQACTPRGRFLGKRDALAEQPAQQGQVVWTLLLTGENQGLVGKAGEKFVGHPEHYERVDVYTSPQRTWVGLTDEEWQSIADTLGCFITRGQKDAIEAALGIKENTQPSKPLLEPDYYVYNIDGQYRLADPQPTIKWGNKC